MKKYLLYRVGILFLCLVLGGALTLSAQEETVIVSASGFGATQEKALEQASYHAVISVVKNNFSSNNAFAVHNEEIRQFIQENLSGFLGDPSEVKIIKKYRRNKLTARIPIKMAEVVAAVKLNFPDLEAP